MQVYWIHRQTHSDIKSEGYVGVSSDPIRRIGEHRRQKRNRHLSNAFSAYDDIVVDIVFDGDEDLCLLLEISLRPETDIGWNISPGGDLPPNFSGLKQSKSHRDKISEAHKGKVKPYVSDRNSRLNKGLVSCYDTSGNFQRVSKDEFYSKRGIELFALNSGKRLTRNINGH